jgi:kynurenine 3-monooxygenase
MAERRPRVVAVVGAGPVGCLAALSMAKFGCQVHIYEGRPGEAGVPEWAPISLL